MGLFYFTIMDKNLTKTDQEYQNYLDELKSLNEFLIRDFPKFYQRIKDEVNELWSDFISNVPELKKSKTINIS